MTTNETTQERSNETAEMQLRILRRYAEQNMPKLPYHNSQHAEEVVGACERLAYFAGLNENETFLLKSAAYLHDIIYEVGKKDNEERSAEVAQEVLEMMQYSPNEIETVKGLILATKLPTKPETMLQKIICDADVDNLGTENGLENGEKLRQEFGVRDRSKWLQGNLQFFRNHRYYTPWARGMRNYGLRLNIRKLEQMTREVTA